MDGWMFYRKTCYWQLSAICHYQYYCKVLFILVWLFRTIAVYLIQTYMDPYLYFDDFSLHSGAGYGSRGVHRHPHREAAPGGGVPREGYSPVLGGRGASQKTEGALSGRQTWAGAGGGGSNQTGILGTVSTRFLIVQRPSDKGDHEATRMAN